LIEQLRGQKEVVERQLNDLSIEAKAHAVAV